MIEEWKEVVAEWQGEMTFTGTNSNGGQVQMGMLGGKPGVSPMEILLLGLAGCTGLDIVSILKKKRVQLDKFQILVRGRRAEDYPMVWKEIEVTYHLWGVELKPKDVMQAIRLSEKKYCSVGIMLGATADIRSHYQIHNSLEVEIE